MHEGHRERMKIVFCPKVWTTSISIRYWNSSYSFHSQKRHQPLAHELIKRYGSLSGVLKQAMKTDKGERHSRNTALLYL